MKYNYAAVTTSNLTFQGIVTKIQGNNEALRNLENGLKGSFTGVAAERGWHPTIDRLMAKIDAYNARLENLKKTVEKVAGEGGGMHVTDKDQGGRFLALGI
ncbi:WXG100 family type VII secretion target [Nocardia asteroides]